MKKHKGIFWTGALAISLVLSSCSIFPEEKTNVDSITDRLSEATGFDWQGTPTIESDYFSEAETNFWDSSGLIQDMFPADQRECLIRVFVFENDAYAKKAQASPFFDRSLQGVLRDFDWQFEDPVTKYGIILLDYGNPCSDAAAKAFEYTLSQ